MGRANKNVNRIPDAPPNINDATRVVKIGYRSVGGRDLDSKVNFLRQLFTKKANVGDTSEVPNPICHWCVVVGDYYHQLQASGDFPAYKNWYDNNKVDQADGWALFKVGETNFNDIAIKNAGEFSIDLMPEVYNLYNNNCQTFTVTLLDQICRVGRVRVTTSYAANQANYLPGMEAESEEGKVEVAVPLNGVKHAEFLNEIKDLMEAETPAVTEEELAKAKAAMDGGA